MKNLITITLLFISIGLFADGVQPTGAGTSGDPYQVETLDNLLWISTNTVSWDKYFIQTADFDASSTSGWNSSAGFSPIGNNPNYFSGNYDGQGFFIDGLFINRPNTDYIGLFGHINNAEISKLGVAIANITSHNYVGGLVGTSNNSTITNSYSTGSVSGSTDVGGLVGYTYYSTITNCYSSGSVSGTSYTGGLVGFTYYSNINHCYSTGSVSGTSYTGGLVGYNINSNFSNSFWDTETSGQTTSAGGAGKTTAEMHTESTFTDAGWDFNSVWDINYYGIDYPYLRWQDSAPEGSIPNSPENIQIDIIDPDAIITWDAVTESIDDYSIVVDGYIVLYSENNIDFFFLVLTIDTSYTHEFVATLREDMYYQVMTIKNYSSRQISYLQELNNSTEKLKWNEVKRNLERMK